MDLKQRKAMARKLRKMADELDPPATAIPPRLEDVRQYCLERNNDIDADAFMDFYESKGWLVGKARMKNWQCAVRNAERGGYFREGNNGTHQDRRRVEQQSSLRAIAQAAGTGESVIVSVPHEASGDIHN